MTRRAPATRARPGDTPRAPAGRIVVPTEQGDAHVLIDRPVSPGRPRFLLALTHGAGGGVESADLLAARDAAVAADGVVARILQPYRVRGARAPGSAARQDAAWVRVMEALRETALGGPGGGAVPLIQGGRSNGARVACRTAGQAGARAVIALAFPLHPPGHPEKSRRDELRCATAAGADVLVVNGSRDPFGVPGPADAGGPGSARIVVLEGETHQLSKDPAAVGAAVSSWFSGWVHDRGVFAGR